VEIVRVATKRGDIMRLIPFGVLRRIWDRALLGVYINTDRIPGSNIDETVELIGNDEIE
jgi:hypothetical protein